MSYCQVRSQGAVCGDGYREGGGDQRPDGLEELKKVKVTDDEEEEPDKEKKRGVVA